MKELKNNCYKGTRILIGNSKRDLINDMINSIKEAYPKAEEIEMPIINFETTFEDKVGVENNNMMYSLSDRKGRALCLAPEYTSIVQGLLTGPFKYSKDAVLFYVSECFRGEKPQRGRYRQFTQLGVEILNPSCLDQSYKDIEELALELCRKSNLEIELDSNAVRGLSFYKDDKGFEIKAPELGSSQQICGGGIYEGGLGFAIGIDRLIQS